MNQVYIISASRTPIGSCGGKLAGVSATELGAEAIRALFSHTSLKETDVQSVIMGNVLSAGLGQAPARQAALAAGLPTSVCATTVNKVCSSGMKAVDMLRREIAMGEISLGIAGGMESMSRVPYYLPSARFGMGYASTGISDGLFLDGLLDAGSSKSMGVFADVAAERFGISRAALDEYAERSYRLSAESWDKGYFLNEVSPVSLKSKKGEIQLIDRDEEYSRANFEKMRLLKPAFSEGGSMTAANSSPMSDGAAAMLLASEDAVNQHELKPIARILSFADAEQDPDLFTSSPVPASRLALERAGLQLGDIDAFEVNEAFSLVPLIYASSLEISTDKINQFGGAVSLGHPLGASGARIICTLLNVLKVKGGRYGLAAICNGGGGASAIIIERL